MTPFALDTQSGIGRHSHLAYIEAKLRDSDYQHVQFMIYRRRVIPLPDNSSSDRRWRKHYRRSSHAGGEEDLWEGPAKGGDRQNQGDKLSDRRKA